MRRSQEKNKSFVIVLGIFFLCLITTCVVGTTLAKYATSGSTNDEARIAKWGVTVSVEADPLFKNEYSTNNNSLLVKSNSNVVAPGTSSKDAKSSTIFVINGTPEVAAKIKIDIKNIENVYLKAGTYTDPTKSNSKFTLDSDYYPVEFVLRQKNTSEGDVILVEGTLSDIKNYFNTNYNKSYDPNTTLDATFELAWVWSFDKNDKADTYLGNLIAGVNPDNLTSADYNLIVKYELVVTVEQVG